MSSQATPLAHSGDPRTFDCFVIGETTLVILCSRQILERGHEIKGVISDNPEVMAWAMAQGVRLIDPASDFEAELSDPSYDYLFSFVNSRVLSAKLLDAPRRFVINFHDGPLPRYAGLHATSWAILHGETTHGITWHIASEKVDAGPILTQRAVSIGPAETALSLNVKCYEAGVDAFAEVLDQLEDGTVAPRAQDLSLRTYFGRASRPPAAGILVWSHSSSELSALVRALDFGSYANPLGRSKLDLGGALLACTALTVAPNRSGAPAGTIVALDQDSLTVAAADADVIVGGFMQLDGTPVSLRQFADRHELRPGGMLPILSEARIQAIEVADVAAARAEAFWTGRLTALRPAAAPYAGQRAAADPGAGLEVPVTLPADRSSPLLRGEEFVTTVVAALAVYLWRVGTDGALDLGLKADGDAFGGLFASVVPLRIEVEAAQSFNALRTAVAAELALVRHRGAYGSGLISREPSLRVRGAARLPVQVDASGTFGSGLAEPDAGADLHVILDADARRCALRCRSGDIDLADAERIADQLGTLLAGALAAPDATAIELPLMPESMRQRLLGEWNDTAKPVPAGIGVHDLISAQVARTPDAVAVELGTDTMNFSQLEGAANRLAHVLRRHGVGRGTLVAVCLQRSFDLVVSLFAVLKTGAAYVPMDPEYPAERLAAMLDDVRPPVILTHDGLRDALPLPGSTVLCLDALKDVLALEPVTAAAASPDFSDGDLAYVIFTSGSTGRPKGVQIPHRAVVNFLLSMADAPGLGPADRILAPTTPAFDMAQFELLLPLTVGAVMVLAPPGIAADGSRLSALLADSRATVMEGTPSTWRLMFESGWAGTPGLKVLCGGEAMPAELATRILGCGMTLWNMYGPTETTVWSAVRRMDADSPVVIGMPIANTQLYVLDARRELVPIGIPGELYIGGAGLARGYLNRPELTAERFVPNPFGPPGTRLYRTGDIVRRRADGTLDFVGRSDNQVKLRGYRIELGEIESVLMEAADIANAAVAVLPGPGGEPRLVGYYVVRGGAAPDEASLREQLHRRLPDYMVPAALMRLDVFPLTPAGKLDRKALPEPVVPASATDAGEGTDNVRDELAVIWEELLGVAHVSMHDNFFDLGGHSLLAVRLVQRINESFGRTVALADLFHEPTIAHLAQVLAIGAMEAAPPPVVQIRGGDGPALFFLHGDFAFGGLYCQRLVRFLPEGRPIYVLHPHQPGGPATVEAMAADYADRILAVQPRGPYRFAGVCNGGVIAFELARQLTARGKQVELVAMINSRADNITLAPILRALEQGGKLMRWDAERRSTYVAWHYPALLEIPDRLPRITKRKWVGRAAAAIVLAKLMVGSVARRVWRTSSPAGSPAEPPAVTGSSIESVQVCRARHIEAAMQQYVPSAYKGVVTLVWAEEEFESLRRDQTLGWEAVADRIAVCVIPGGHHTILTRQLAGLGNTLRQLLEQCDARRPDRVQDPELAKALPGVA